MMKVFLVPCNDVRDHPVCDARTNFFSHLNVSLQLFDSLSLLRVLLVLQLQLHKTKETL